MFPEFVHLLDKFHILQSVNRNANKSFAKEAVSIVRTMMATRSMNHLKFLI